MVSEAGKGSKPRPRQVSNEDYAQAWDLIFKRDKENEENIDLVESDHNTSDSHNKTST